MIKVMPYDLGIVLQEATNVKHAALSRVEGLQNKCDALREERELLFKMTILRKRILDNLEDSVTTWGSAIDEAKEDVTEVEEEYKVVVDSMFEYTSSLVSAENEYEACIIKVDTIIQFMREQNDDAI
jgi:ABC-type cobalt transport system substrate-binding protein